MSVIKHVLNEELDRLEQLSLKYEDEIRKLPNGSLAKKMRNGKAYIYLAYRDKDRVKFNYIGKESSEAVQKALVQREQRQEYINNLRQVKNDIKEIKRALHGSGR